MDYYATKNLIKVPIQFTMTVEVLIYQSLEMDKMYKFITIALKIQTPIQNLEQPMKHPIRTTLHKIAY